MAEIVQSVSFQSEEERANQQQQQQQQSVSSSSSSTSTVTVSTSSSSSTVSATTTTTNNTTTTTTTAATRTAPPSNTRTRYNREKLKCSSSYFLYLRTETARLQQPEGSRLYDLLVAVLVAGIAAILYRRINLFP